MMPSAPHRPRPVQLQQRAGTTFVALRIRSLSRQVLHRPRRGSRFVPTDDCYAWFCFVSFSTRRLRSSDPNRLLFRGQTYERPMFKACIFSCLTKVFLTPSRPLKPSFVQILLCTTTHKYSNLKGHLLMYTTKFNKKTIEPYRFTKKNRLRHVQLSPSRIFFNWVVPEERRLARRDPFDRRRVRLSRQETVE